MAIVLCQNFLEIITILFKLNKLIYKLSSLIIIDFHLETVRPFFRAFKHKKTKKKKQLSVRELFFLVPLCTIRKEREKKTSQKRLFVVVDFNLHLKKTGTQNPVST